MPIHDAAPRCRNSLATLLLFLAGISPVVSAQAAKSAKASPLDIEHSTVTVHVYRSGLFSFAGDNHEIQAPIASGTVDEAAGTVELTVEVRRMRVLDPNLSADKRSQVQQKMLSPDVLDPDRYPEIQFRSTRVEQKGGGELSVSGNLMLHGQTRPINVRVLSAQLHYRGSAALKQTDFGIKPITIAGGTIKVKDEVRIDFDIVRRQP
jgi:polyisoprenoid-binding protein YceI